MRIIPSQGIYAVRGVLRSGTYAGALHLGPRPTFKGSPPTIELHLLDFDADIYGEEVRVDFVEHLRGVEPYHEHGGAGGADPRGRGRGPARVGGRGVRVTADRTILATRGTRQ